MMVDVYLRGLERRYIGEVNGRRCAYRSRYDGSLPADEQNTREALEFFDMGETTSRKIINSCIESETAIGNYRIQLDAPMSYRIPGTAVRQALSGVRDEHLGGGIELPEDVTMAVETPRNSGKLVYHQLALVDAGRPVVTIAARDEDTEQARNMVQDVRDDVEQDIQSLTDAALERRFTGGGLNPLYLPHH